MLDSPADLCNQKLISDICDENDDKVADSKSEFFPIESKKHEPLERFHCYNCGYGLLRTNQEVGGHGKLSGFWLS